MPYRIILNNISLEQSFPMGIPGIPGQPIPQPTTYVFNYNLVHDGPPPPGAPGMPPPPFGGQPPLPPPQQSVVFNNGMQQSFPLTVRVPHGPSLDQAQNQARQQIADFLHDLAGAAIQQ